MPQKKDVTDLAQAFDTAWLELRAWGIEANTEQQKTKLAQRIIEYATKANMTLST